MYWRHKLNIYNFTSIGGGGLYQLLNSLHTVIKELIKPLPWQLTVTGFQYIDYTIQIGLYRKQNTNWNIQMMSLCTPCSYVKTFSAHYFGTHYLIKIAFMLLWSKTIIDTRSPQRDTWTQSQHFHLDTVQSLVYVLSDQRWTVTKLLRTQPKISPHTQHPFRGPPRY